MVHVEHPDITNARLTGYPRGYEEEALPPVFRGYEIDNDVFLAELKRLDMQNEMEAE